MACSQILTVGIQVDLVLIRLIQVKSSLFVERKGRNALFNDALSTFYLRLYCVGLMVKDHSDGERGNPLHPAKDILYAP